MDKWRYTGFAALFLTGMLVLAMLWCGTESEYNRQIQGHSQKVVKVPTKASTEQIDNTIQRLNEAVSDGLRAVRIDSTFARYDSPLEGYGHVFVRESNRTGIPAELPAAIAGKESYFATQCFAPHNAWGMLAYPEGFASWEEGIVANFNWLVHYYGCPQMPYECSGYCVSDHPWMEDAAEIMSIFGW